MRQKNNYNSKYYYSKKWGCLKMVRKMQEKVM